MRELRFLTIIWTLTGMLSGLKIVEVTDYWPEVNEDLSLITWSHATNSHQELAEALTDGTMMIEADVSIGPNGEPIMAHPPATTSDLSLQQFLDIVIAETEKGTKKGIKLDFKAIEIVEPSLKLIETVKEKLNFPVWLNADIIVGPGGGDPVDPDRFLELCQNYLPEATLSPGFTTGLGLLGHYTEEHMSDLYNKLIEKRTFSPVTVPIRAKLGAKSVAEIKQFMDIADKDNLFPVTLTIWSAVLDLVDLEGLAELVLTVGKDRVYVDVPWDYESPDRSLMASEAKAKGGGSILRSLNSIINFSTVMF